MSKPNKLLLIGPSKGSTHLKNYFNLIQAFFTEIQVVSDGEFSECESTICDFGLKNPIQLYKSVSKIKAIIKAFQPDVIHVHQANSYALISVLANRKKRPLVLTAWGSDVLLLPQKGFLLKSMVKYVLKQADYITADASFMIRAINDLGVQNNIVLANFGIELIDNPNAEKKNFIYSNRLHKTLYNVGAIIAAFAEFHKNHSSWKLIIGANGDLTEQHKKQAALALPEDAYEFVGFVNAETNASYYTQSKIWVSIPNSDGTSISLLEAMGYGCIPIVSDLPANNEWIKDSENGIVVKDHDLLNAFDKALALDFTTVKEINSDIIDKKATKEVNYKLFCNIYENLLAND